MQIITSLYQIPALPDGCIATIGNFDGVHQGHQQLIRLVTEKARQLNIPALVVTFDPHPELFFHPDDAPPLLMSLDSKLATFAELGVAIALVLPFDAAFSAMQPKQFIEEILVKQLHVQQLFIGHDYTFGKGKSGNAALLSKLGEQHNFCVEQLEPFFVEYNLVSSTRIRSSITAGNVEEAALLLGRPYYSEGTIVHGKNRGEKLLGFPTANISYEKNIITPKDGVYVVKAQLCTGPAGIGFCQREAPLLAGVASIGTNPTFGNATRSLEVFLLDFTENIYHTYMKVFFLQRLRDEQKFSSLEELKQQITRDVAKARTILST